MTTTLSRRIGKLEQACPPPRPGCDACRGRTVFGLGQFTRGERGGAAVAVCAGCGRGLDDGRTVFIAVNIKEVL